MYSVMSQLQKNTASGEYNRKFIISNAAITFRQKTAIMKVRFPQTNLSSWHLKCEHENVVVCS